MHYRQIDVRDVPGLNEVVKSISDSQGKLDGLIAAAGIQQETPALEYTAKDANLMFEVSLRRMRITGVPSVHATLVGQRHRRFHDCTGCGERDDSMETRR